MPIPKLSKKDIELVSHNFQNIYSATHDKKLTLELVPSLIGNHVYCPSVGWKGRILKLFHRLLIYFLGDSYFNNKLKKSIQTTQDCFARLETFRHHYHDSIFQDYLEKRFRNEHCQFSAVEIENARKQIKLFYQATNPLVELVKTHINEKLQLFLNSHFQSGQTPFYCEETFKDVRYFIRLMAIEGFTNGELPLHLFQRMSFISDQQNENTQNIDQKVLVSFIKKISKAKEQGTFQVDLFHKAMKSIVSYLKKSCENENNYDLKSLEKALIKEGCILLDEFDTKHTHWRQHLKKEDPFLGPNEQFYFLNDRYEKLFFSLGDPVKGLEKREDRYHVYEMINPQTSQKYEDYLMIIGPNKICLEYIDLMRSESSWGLETPKIHYIHPKGKYAIIEKLPTGTGSIDWKSDLRGALVEEDLTYAEAFRLLMQFFMEEKNSPKDFNTDYLKFDTEGHLKSIKDFIPCGYIDFIALEEAAFKLAQSKNLPVYQHIVAPLRNEKRPISFFQKVIASAFDKPMLPVERLVKRCRIVDPKIIQRGKDLQRYANFLKTDCFQAITTHYPSVNKDQLQTQIANFIKDRFNQDQTFGRLWLEPEELVEKIELEVRK